MTNSLTMKKRTKKMERKRKKKYSKMENVIKKIITMMSRRKNLKRKQYWMKPKIL